MGDQLGRFVGWVEHHFKRLHNLVGITPGEVVVVVAWVTLHVLTLPRAHHLEGVQFGSRARQDFRELHAKLACHMVDGRNRHVLARCFPCFIGFNRHVQVRGHFFHGHVTGLTQPAKTLTNFLHVFFFSCHMSSSRCKSVVEYISFMMPAKRCKTTGVTL